MSPAPDSGVTVTSTGGAVSPGFDPAVQARSAAAIPPSLYRRFEGFEPIGSGGMGAVYRARDIQVGRTVAIKILFAGDAGGGLLQEARSQARLEHPNVCEVFEAGFADRVPFIVMRYVGGASMAQARADMTLEAKVGVIRRIALALHEAHRMGLVHRDVKPANLLVERAEDGTWTPYIADFGIARDVADVADAAATTTGAQGTPAFMAPEQASGKAAAVDRRTDVYGLGATLYDVLAGRPPLVAATVPALLRMVVEEAPPPVRAVAPAVPVDLEAIVMKCLEKDPAERYDSARALADDLQAFLDGDPVAARRPPWVVSLGKRARRHKGKVAAAALALGLGLALGGLWLRNLRIADERAVLSRELGGDVREMEMFLRDAYSMPLHDVERERDVVRGRLRDIAARVASGGAVAAGPGNDALGRGHLALQEPQEALSHLQRARDTGYSAPGLDYAMARARIELYREGLERASRLQSASERAAFLAELEREQRDPALSHLRAALAQGVESPAYALGLVALLENRLDDALARAQEAFAAAPWLHEAKKLEGDVLFAIGRRSGHDRAFDHERAVAAFEGAAAAYRAAAEHARSDPSVHEQECNLWIQVMNAAAEHGDSMRPGFERAKAACERAITASPRGGSGHMRLAWAHNCFAFWVVSGMRSEGSPAQVLAEATARVEEAARLNPGDPFASYLVGAVWRSRALDEGIAGRDQAPALDRAVAAYAAALAGDPGCLWAQNELCGSLAWRGEREALRGLDPAPTFRAALDQCERALELDPDFLFPRANILLVHMTDAERLVVAGRSPAAAVTAGLAAATAAAARHPAWRWLPYWRARLFRVQMEYDSASGADPHAALSGAEAATAVLAEMRGSFQDGGAAEGEVLAVKAEALVARLESGGGATLEAELSAALAGARAALGAAHEQAPWEVGYAVWLARAEIAALRRRLAAGGASDAEAEAVLAPLAPFLTGPREDPRLYEMAARAREVRAERLRRLGRDDAGEIAAGIAHAERAVAVGPGFVPGRAVLGRLRLAQARATRDPAQRRERARLAAEALAAAVRQSALLGRTHAALLAEAERMGEG